MESTELSAREEKDRKRAHSLIQLTEGQLSDIRNAFLVFVQNPDEEKALQSKIDVKDVRVVLRSLGYEPSKEELKLLYSSIDKDQSGTINFDTFLSLLTTRMASKETKDQITKAFRLFTAYRREGPEPELISFEDLRTVAHQIGFEVSDDELRTMMAEVDTDGDGLIDLNDFMAVARICLLPSHVFPVTLRNDWFLPNPWYVDVPAQRVEGFVEISIAPEPGRDFREIRLHARQIRITQTLVNGHVAMFEYHDPLGVVIPEQEKIRDLSSYNAFYRLVQEGADEGELVVKVPTSVTEQVQKYTSPSPFLVMLTIHYELDHPVAGFHFYNPGDYPPHTAPSRIPAHAYTWVDTCSAPAHLWFPCFEGALGMGCGQLAGAGGYGLGAPITASDMKKPRVADEKGGMMGVPGPADDQAHSIVIEDEDEGAISSPTIGVASQNILPRCTFTIELSTAPENIVVCTGQLVNKYVSKSPPALEFRYQLQRQAALDANDPAAPVPAMPTRTVWVHEVRVPLPASSLGVAVGPFQVYPDPRLPRHLTHFSLAPVRTGEVAHTTAILPQALSFLASYLGLAPLPRPRPPRPRALALPSAHALAGQSHHAALRPDGLLQAGLPARAPGRSCPAAMMSLLSAELLHTEPCIEAQTPARLAQVSAAAASYFGHFITPRLWDDVWLMVGMPTYLAHKFLEDLAAQAQLRVREAVKPLQAHVTQMLATEAAEAERTAKEAAEKKKTPRPGPPRRPRGPAACGPHLGAETAARDPAATHRGQRRAGRVSDMNYVCAHDNAEDGMALIPQRRSVGLLFRCPSRLPPLQFFNRSILTRKLVRLKAPLVVHMLAKRAGPALQQHLAHLCQVARQTILTHHPSLMSILNSSPEPSASPLPAPMPPSPSGLASPPPPPAGSPAAPLPYPNRLAALEEAIATQLTMSTWPLVRQLRHMCAPAAADIRATAEYYIKQPGVPALSCGFQYTPKKERVVVTVVQDSPHNPKRDSVRTLQRQPRVVRCDDESNPYGAAVEMPVRWMRVDPECAWLGRIVLNQTEIMLTTQLREDPDVIGKITAVQGLSMMDSKSSIKTLGGALSNPLLPGPVRCEVAKALGYLVRPRPDQPPLVKFAGEYLLCFFRERYFDGDASLARPNNFADHANYALLKARHAPALHRALGWVRDPNGYTPGVVMDALLTTLMSNDMSALPRRRPGPVAVRPTQDVAPSAPPGRHHHGAWLQDGQSPPPPPAAPSTAAEATTSAATHMRAVDAALFEAYTGPQWETGVRKTALRCLAQLWALLPPLGLVPRGELAANAAPASPAPQPRRAGTSCLFTPRPPPGPRPQPLPRRPGGNLPPTAGVKPFLPPCAPNQKPIMGYGAAPAATALTPPSASPAPSHSPAPAPAQPQPHPTPASPTLGQPLTQPIAAPASLPGGPSRFHDAPGAQPEAAALPARRRPRPPHPAPGAQAPTYMRGMSMPLAPNQKPQLGPGPAGPPGTTLSPAPWAVPPPGQFPVPGGYPAPLVTNTTPLLPPRPATADPRAVAPLAPLRLNFRQGLPPPNLVPPFYQTIHAALGMTASDPCPAIRLFALRPVVCFFNRLRAARLARESALHAHQQKQQQHQQQLQQKTRRLPNPALAVPGGIGGVGGMGAPPYPGAPQNQGVVACAPLPKEYLIPVGALAGDDETFAHCGAWALLSLHAHEGTISRAVAMVTPMQSLPASGPEAATPAASPVPPAGSPAAAAPWGVGARQQGQGSPLRGAAVGPYGAPTPPTPPPAGHITPPPSPSPAPSPALSAASSPASSVALGAGGPAAAPLPGSQLGPLLFGAAQWANFKEAVLMHRGAPGMEDPATGLTAAMVTGDRVLSATRALLDQIWRMLAADPWLSFHGVHRRRLVGLFQTLFGQDIPPCMAGEGFKSAVIPSRPGSSVFGLPAPKGVPGEPSSKPSHPSFALTSREGCKLKIVRRTHYVPSFSPGQGSPHSASPLAARTPGSGSPASTRGRSASPLAATSGASPAPYGGVPLVSSPVVAPSEGGPFFSPTREDTAPKGRRAPGTPPRQPAGASSRPMVGDRKPRIRLIVSEPQPAASPPQSSSPPPATPPSPPALIASSGMRASPPGGMGPAEGSRKGTKHSRRPPEGAAGSPEGPSGASGAHRKQARLSPALPEPTDGSPSLRPLQAQSPFPSFDPRAAPKPELSASTPASSQPPSQPSLPPPRPLNLSVPRGRTTPTGVPQPVSFPPPPPPPPPAMPTAPLPVVDEDQIVVLDDDEAPPPLPPPPPTLPGGYPYPHHPPPASAASSAASSGLGLDELRQIDWDEPL
ncbi:putative centrin 4 L homeolog [Paratrimastix pyriformis]|uniref:Transcription initiation factor TFIID subunit 2 n=1 Tax=Paratrimastix pyriformis TaxID=342808 RepID=A0ABQ8UNH6_9EUKA|nr:putative centrin 4 L homeolog [Paratrimastix pyriformis]